MGKSALLVGASGLVGEQLLSKLLNGDEYTKVVILVRKTVGITHPKLEEKVIKFKDLSRYSGSFKVDDVFCCVGTTIKKAKTREVFKMVDVDYPLEMAKLAKENQVKKFLIISSLDADANSFVFYSRMKGLLEKQLKTTGLKSLHIFRPSLLLGIRKESRFGEALGAFLAKGLSFAFVGPLKKYKAISATTVAESMYKIAQRDGSKGVHIYHSDEIAKL